MRKPARAKINLALHVIGQRADGYHLLESLVAFTEFGDMISAVAGKQDSFVVTGLYAGEIPPGQDNLVLRARDLVRLTNPGAHCPPVSIILEKNLPVASGVGGGSSDAAATMLALTELWALDRDNAQLAQAAIALGADVPMCLHSRPLIARGVGEEIEPIALFPPLALVLVNPGVAVSTPEVFKALRSRKNQPLPALPDFQNFDAICDFLRSTRNDLELPAIALVPQISLVLDGLRASGAALTRMSGSGATCFGLFDTVERAESAARTITNDNPGWFVTATTTTIPKDRDYGQN